MKCPRDHTLPNQTQWGQCTPLYCAIDTATVKDIKKKQKPAKVVKEEARALAGTIEEATPGYVPEQVTNQAALLAAGQNDELAKQLGRMANRYAFLNVPQDLKGQAALDWSDARLEDLLPLAIADLEYSIRLGNAEERAKARDKIMDANGRGKKEQSGIGNSPIIILNGASVQQLPWSNKKPAQVIDVTPEKADE